MGGLTSLLLLLCVGVTLSAMLDLQKRIMGGHHCGQNESLFHVRLVGRNQTRVSRCGGSLISDSWILTAAHCWKDGWNMTVEVGVHPNGGQPVPITRHEIFSNGQNGIHDIMLLQLPNPTQINNFIPLPDCGPGQQPAVGDIVRIAGYGRTHLHGTIRPRRLQCANLPKVDCNWLTMHTNYTDPGRYLFCGSAPGVSVCPGDSGGGVEYNGRIYGVIHGVTNDTCNPFSAFMNVCEYMGWIGGITGIH